MLTSAGRVELLHAVPSTDKIRHQHFQIQPIFSASDRLVSGTLWKEPLRACSSFLYCMVLCSILNMYLLSKLSEDEDKDEWLYFRSPVTQVFPRPLLTHYPTHVLLRALWCDKPLCECFNQAELLDVWSTVWSVLCTCTTLIKLLSFSCRSLLSFLSLLHFINAHWQKGRRQSAFILQSTSLGMQWGSVWTKNMQSMVHYLERKRYKNTVVLDRLQVTS